MVLPETGNKLTLDVKNRAEIEENIPKSTYTKWFDYDKINKVILLRTPEPGDEMAIFTDGRKKSLSDILAEAKLPTNKRAACPVLAEGNQLLWIPGIRGSAGYYVTKETKRVLIATINGGKENG